MAVSKEFIQAIKEKNELRIRLMLKNSLLLDTSFRSFWEMVRVAESNGIEVWMENSGHPLERKSKPWSMDDMNYEITAVVNDFTEEHIRYLMDIIGEVYQTNASSNSKKMELYVEILRQLFGMRSSIKSSRRDMARNLSTKDIGNIMWTNELIYEIRVRAQRIVECCDEILGR